MRSSILMDFNEIFTGVKKEVGPLHGAEPEICHYMTVHNDDLEPVSIVQPNLKEGPWIAGGAALKWWQNMPVGDSDIDVFCRDSLQADAVIERLMSYGRWTEKYKSENAVTLEYWNKGDLSKKWVVQIIKRRYFKNLEDVINNFDITVCQVGTCGYDWELGPFTAKDIRDRNLRFKLPLQPDCVKRLTKYWIYGYRPVDSTIEHIVNTATTKWKYNMDEDYQNAF